MRSLGAIALLTAVLAGCGAPTAQVPPAPSAPTVQPPPSLAVSDFQAPPVAEPLDTAAFQESPCTSLPADDAGALGASGGRERPTQGGSGCTWAYGGDGTLEVLWSGATGLDAVYQSRHLSAYFEPLPELDGYPAVTSERRDDRPAGACSIHVGTADTAMFTVSVRQPRGQVDTPCSTATAAASAVLAAIRAG